MKWSWRLATVAGIGVYVHVTFLLLLVWAAWHGYALEHHWLGALASVSFILTLFVIVVLHELGHALTARRFGIPTRDITLLPIGGVARLERMPEDPKQELLVALAGPAVNVVLAVLLYGILLLLGQVPNPGQLMLTGGNFLSNLMLVNIVLAVFNMLPAFPMDGGRVLRALLAFKMSYARATRIAARIGQGMALIFGVAVFLGFAGILPPMNPFLALIALFVWMGATQESGMVQMKSALGGIRVGQVMITDFRVLAPDDTLSRAVAYLLAGYQQDFPVVAEDRIAGVLTRAGLINALARLDQGMPVADAMERHIETVHPEDSVERVFARLQNTQCKCMPVLLNGRLVGILTPENVGEFLMIHAALQNESRTGSMGANDGGTPGIASLAGKA